MDWEWYGDHNVFSVFLYLLLSANHKNSRWKGVVIKKGQLVTGRHALYEGLNRNPKTGRLNKKSDRITVQNIRTALKKLKSTNEITIETTNQYSLITINNWDRYQNTNQGTNQQLTSDQPATNQQLTTNKNNKNVKNVKNKREYLLNISDKDVDNFSSIFKCSKRQVKEKGEELFDYVKAHGKRYKDYKAVLRNALRKDYGKRPKNPLSELKEVEIDEEGLKKLGEVREKIFKGEK